MPDGKPVIPHSAGKTGVGAGLGDGEAKNEGNGFGADEGDDEGLAKGDGKAKHDFALTVECYCVDLALSGLS